MLLAQTTSDPKESGVFLLAIVVALVVIALGVMLVSMRAWRRYFLSSREAATRRSKAKATPVTDLWRESGQRLMNRIDEEGEDSADDDDEEDEPGQEPDPTRN